MKGLVSLAMQEITGQSAEHAPDSKSKKKVLIFVMCSNTEALIEGVLGRIPKDIWGNMAFDTEVLVIDDQSSDRTFYRAVEYGRKRPEWNFSFLYNPKSQGYGGNQKLAYLYAMENGFDAVVLLRGDGQYAPECLTQLLQPILTGQADAALGSRMLRRTNALKEGMPLFKWAANGVLTFIQNRILGLRLSEYYSGYRAFAVPALASVPFDHNSNGLDFDTDILIQFSSTRKRIQEIAVPTFHGREMTVVDCFKYATHALDSCILSKVMQLGIYYHPKFDYERDSNYRYKEKFGYASSHQFALDQIRDGTTVLDIGCGPGFMAASLARKGVRTVSIDRQIQPRTRENSWRCVECDVENYGFEEDFGKIDYVLALDIIEHLKSPENLFCVLRKRFSRDASTIIITTGNVAFLPIRLSLLFSGFHYGSRGILDMDHTRLFTFSSLQRILDLNGYEVISKEGLPAPFPLALGEGYLAHFLLLLNQLFIRLSKSLFSYQIAFIVKPLPSLAHLLEDAVEAREMKLGTPS